MNPCVKTLQIYFSHQYQVQFYKHQNISDTLNDDNHSKTMLT